MNKPIQDKSKDNTKNTTSYQIVDRKDRYNYKLTDIDKEEIILEHFIDNSKANVMNICKRYNISEQYVYKLIKIYKQKNLYDKVVEKNIAESRKKFSKKVDKILDKALNKINKKLDDGEDINLSQLATLTGILYDKNALEQGKSTSNQAININVKIDN